MKAASFLGVFALLAGAHAMACTYDSGKGATYDLSALNDGAAHEVDGQDFPGTTANEGGYTYKFAVCSNVKSPALCTQEHEPPAPVYQVSVNNPTCHSLSRNADSVPGVFKLLDANEAAAGVVLQYADSTKWCHGDANGFHACDSAGATTPAGCNQQFAGGKCANVDGKGGVTSQSCQHNNDCIGADVTCMGKARQTRIHFQCSKDKGMVVSKFVYERNANSEPSHCDYEFTISSMRACPTECKIGGDAGDICSAHGLCGYDASNSKAKCFCDDGWMGDDCNTAGDATVGANGGTTAALVILILLVIGLVAGVWFLAKQVKAYRNDASNYMQIRSQELGSMSVDQI